MRKIMLATGLVAALGACSAVAVPPANAGDVPTVMVFGEDWDKDTFERDNRVFNRVLDSLMSEFHEKGFRVYDERAMTGKAGFAQDRQRRTDTELLDIARRQKSPPIDLALMFQIYPEVKRLSHITDIKTRIRARMVQVRSGRFVDAFEDDKAYEAPVDCSKTCMWETIGKHSKEIARDVGAWMGQKLGNQVYAQAPAAQPVTAAPAAPAEPQAQAAAPTNAPAAPPKQAGPSTCPAYTKDYMLVFDGFSPQEVTQAEKYLVIFTGYCSHRPVQSGMNLTKFTYESGISDAHLKRNLDRLLFEVFKGQGMVQMKNTENGQEYIVKKMGTPKTRPVQDSGW